MAANSGSDRITIEIDADTRKAIDNLAKLKSETNKTGEAAEKTSVSFRNIASGVAAGAATMVAASVSALNLAAHLEQQERTIKRLGSAYNAVSAATNGVITAQQALTLQGQIQAAGIQVNERALSALTRQAREWADVTGNDANQAIEKLTNAIVNNSEDALSEMNLSMARGTTGAQTLTNVVRELEERFRGASPPARTLAQDLAKLPEGIEAIGAMALRTAEGPLERIFNGFVRLGGAIAGVNTEGMTFRRTLGELANAGDDLRAIQAGQADTQRREARRQARERAIAAIQRRGFTVDVSGLGGLSGLSESELTQLANAAGSARSQSNLDSFVSTIAEARQQEARDAERRAGTTNNRVLTPMEAEIERKTRKPRGEGGGAGSNELRDAIREYQRAVAEMPDGAVQVLPSDMPQNPGESATQYYTRLAGIQQGFNSAGAVNDLTPSANASDQAMAEALKRMELAELERERGIAERDRFFQRRSRELGKQDESRAADRERFGQSALGRLERATGLQRNDDGSLSLDAAQVGLGLMEQSLGTLQSGFSQLWSNIADGSMSAGEAFQAFAAQSLKALGQIAINEGTAMLFKAIPAAFTSPPLAVAYGLGGAGLIALGVGLGAAGSAIKPPPAASGNASPSATRGLAPRSARESGGGEMGAVTVVMSSLAPAGPSDASRYRSGIAHAKRYGYGDRDVIPRRVEY